MFELCVVRAGEPAAILAETQSRTLNVQRAELALIRLGARAFHLTVPTPPQRVPVPVRSTGASAALGGLAPVLRALTATPMIVDCTVEGLLHAPELPAILGSGAQVLMVSNEHPEALERLVPDPALKPKVRAAVRRLCATHTMRVTSPAGTDLTIAMAGVRVAGGWGYTDRPGTVAHWPGGVVVAFPAAGTVNGTLVLDLAIST